MTTTERKRANFLSKRLTGFKPTSYAIQVNIATMRLNVVMRGSGEMVVLRGLTEEQIGHIIEKLIGVKFSSDRIDSIKARELGYREFSIAALEAV